MKTNKIIVALVLFFITALSPNSLQAQCNVGQTEIIVTINTKSYGNEVYWKIKNNKGVTVDSVKSKSYFNNNTYYDTLCINNNATYSFETYDVWGDGWNGGTYAVRANGVLLINNSGNSPSNGVNTNGTPSLETTEQFQVRIDTLPDIALYEVLTPNYVNCGVSSLTVSARVKVIDTVSIDSIVAKYRLGTGSTVSETFHYANPLRQDSIVTISFATGITPSAYGNQTLTVWTDLPLDSIFTNDVATEQVFIDSVKSSFPIFNDFEGSNTCGNNSTNCITDGSCNTASIWRNMSNDDIDWSIDQGATPSTGTGPTIDHTNGTSSGKYLYTEASGCQNQTAILQASCVDLSSITNPYLRFWYHMYGSNMGKLFVEIDTGGTWMVLDSLVGQQHSNSAAPWASFLVDLSDYKTQANIRLRAVTGTTFTGDLAIDDIEIRDFKTKDARVTIVGQPSVGACGDSSETITAVISNMGLDTIFGVDVKMLVSGNLSSSATINYQNSLAFGEFDTVYFNNTNLYAGGLSDLWVYSTLSGDLDNTNDTAKTTLDLIKSPVNSTVRDTGTCGSAAIALANNTRIGDTTYWYSDKLGNNLISVNDSLPINTSLNDTIIYFRNKANGGNCFTAIKPVTVVVNKQVNSQLNTYASGDLLSTAVNGTDYDTLIQNDTLRYSTTVPQGFSFGGYGTKWKVNSVSFKTANGYSPTDTLFSTPSTSLPTFQFVPSSKDVDSVFDFSLDLINLQTGCDTVYEKRVVVLARPMAQFMADTVCIGVATSFTNASSITSGNVAYAWDFGDGSTATDTNALHTYANAGSYNVKLIVTSSQGVKDSAVMNVVVEQRPSVSFSANNFCENDSTIIRNASSDATSYLWSFGDGNTSALDSLYYQYAYSGNYTIQLIAYSSFGCTDSATKKISVYDAPQAGFTSANQCFGDSVIIIDTSVNASTVLWNLGDGNTSSLFNPKHLYTTWNDYTITQLVSNANGCLDSAKQTISVYELPSLGLSTSNECFGDTVYVSSNNSKLKNHVWQWGNTYGSVKANGKHLYGSAGTYTIQLQAASLNGCVQTDTIQVTVYPKPKADFTASSVCEGNSTAFSNGSSITTGFISSSWNFGDGNTSTAISPTYKYANAGSYDVTLSVKSIEGCTDTIRKSVSVKENPVPKFSANKGCTGQGVQFSNKTSNGASYKWLFGNGDSSVANAPLHNYQFSGSYNVRLIATSSKNCSVTFDSTIRVYQTPSTIFATQNVCNGLAVPLSNYSTNTASYKWYFGDGSSSNSTLPKHIYSQNGDYTIKLVGTSTSGCMDSTTRTVKIFQKATASFKTNNICLGDTAYFTNESKNANAQSWSFGNGLTSNQTNPVHLYGKSATYDVRLIAETSNGCYDTITKAITIKATPALSFTASSSLCAGEQLSISNKTSGANSYAWAFGDGNSATTSLPSYSYSKDGSYWLKLSATSGSNCTISDSVNVLVHPKPEALFNSKNVCAYESVAFKNTSTINKGKLSYKWSFGDASGTSFLKNPTYQYAKAGVYQVKLLATSGEGCQDSIVETDSIFAIPQLDFSADTVCNGEATSFSNRSHNGLGYNWVMEGQSISTNAPTFTFKNNGKHVVQLVGRSDKNCYDTINKSILVYNKPTSIFTKNNACFGDSVHFTNFSKNATQYNWSLGDGNSITSLNTVHAYQNTGNYSASLIATSSDGCKDTTSATISIYANPSAQYVVNDACENDTNSFTNQSTGANTYSWSFGDGITSTSLNPKYIYGKSGGFTSQLIAYTINGCSDTATRTLQVFSNPIAQFTTTNVCFGDSSYFTNNSTLAASNDWYFGDGNTSQSISPVHYYQNAKKYTARLIVTSTNSCVDSVSKDIFVHVKPTADFAVNNVCLGDSTIITNSSKDANNANWNFENNATSTVWQPSHFYAKKGDYSIHLKVVSSQGCTDTISKLSRVFALPTARFRAANTCGGDTTFFKNKSTGHSMSSWLYQDMTTSTIENPKRIFTKGGYQLTELTVTNTNGCTATYIDSVLIHKKPSIAFDASLYCVNDSIAFKGNEIGDYKWRFGDGNWGNGRLVKHKYDNKGNYNIRIIFSDTNKCMDTLFQNVFVRNNPEADFVNSDVCIGDSMYFTNKSKAASSFAWMLDGITDTITVNPSHYFSNSGFKVVKLIAYNPYGCSDSLITEVAVGDVPTIKFNLTNLCQASEVVFNNNSTVNVGQLHYEWQFDNKIDSSENPKYVFSKDSIYSISLKAISEYGCFDSLTKSYKMKNNPTPILKLPPGCIGKELEFIASTSSAFSIKSIEWLVDNEKNLNDTFRRTFFYPGNHEVTMTLELNNGCFNSVSKDYIVVNSPKSRFITPLESCSNLKVEFIDLSSTNGTEELQYLWRFGNDTISTIQDPVHLFTQPGNYIIRQVVSTINGCADSSQKEIQIFETPDIDIEFKEVGSKVFFSPKDTTLLNYYWDFGNGETSRFTQPNITYDKNGQYFISLNAENNEGCEAQVSKVINLTKTGVVTVSNIEIDVYPNPFSEIVNIRSSNAGEMVYLITSQSGVVLKKFVSSADLVQLDLNHLAKGVYNLHIIGTDFMEIQQLIKI